MEQTNQTNQTEQKKLEDMQGYESPSINLRELEGKKTVIVGYEFMDFPDFYSKVKGETKRIVRFSTDVVHSFTSSKTGEKIEVRASEFFNLVRNNQGNWDFPLNENSKMQKLMRKLKISHPKDVIGKQVIVCIRQKKKKNEQGVEEEKEYLGFMY